MARGFLLLLLLLLSCALHAQVALAHGQVSERALSSDRLRDILFGRVTTWSDGSPIIIIFVDEPAEIAALRHLTGRDLAQLLRGWKRLVYGGNGAMPQVRRTRAEALAEVRRRPGAFTLLSEPVETVGVREIYRDE